MDPVDLGFARRHWIDAPADDGKLTELLTDAQEQVLAFAPALDATATTMPGRYQLATVYQARELAAAAARDGGDIIGPDAYPLRARPLSGAVKALLRPPTGVPVVG